MGGSKKERLELLEAQVERLNGLNDHAEAARQATAEAVAVELASLSADLTSVSDTAQLAVARLVARIETLERREPYGRDALCEAQAAVQIAVAGSGSVDYGNESGHFRACPARYSKDYIGGGRSVGPCKFNCKKDPAGVAEETTTRVDPTQNPPDSKVERMGTLMARGSVGFDTNPDEHTDPEGPREDPEQDRDAARDELAAFSGLQAKRVKAPPILPPLNEILAQSLKQIPRLPRIDTTSLDTCKPWSLERCNCSAQSQDDCRCCPSCRTPAGGGFGKNCFDAHGCGINRDNEVQLMAHNVDGPPIHLAPLRDNSSVQYHICGLLPYVNEILAVESKAGHGAAFLFWGRFWLALLALRDLTGPPETANDVDSIRDFMQTALTGDLGEISERLHG